MAHFYNREFFYLFVLKLQMKLSDDIVYVYEFLWLDSSKTDTFDC